MFDKWPVNQTLVHSKSHLLLGVIESYFANGLIHQGRIPFAGMSCFAYHGSILKKRDVE